MTTRLPNDYLGPHPIAPWRADQLRVFIGYDSREPIAYAVLADSILRRASIPLSITPLVLSSLRRIYTRERGPTESTEFSLTRFLVPYLSNYEGLSLFLDCDMLCQADLLDLLLYPLADPGKAVYVCQHCYTPKVFNQSTNEHGLSHEYNKEGQAFLVHSECDECRYQGHKLGKFVTPKLKFNGQIQTDYPKKNWSSFCLFDNARCKALTPEYVNTATGLQLHRFQWLDSDAQIGALPLEWNWLIGEYAPNPTAKNLHFTLGGPWFAEYRDCDHADLWLAARDRMLDQPVEVPA